MGPSSTPKMNDIAHVRARVTVLGLFAVRSSARSAAFPVAEQALVYE